MKKTLSLLLALGLLLSLTACAKDESAPTAEAEYVKETVISPTPDVISPVKEEITPTNEPFDENGIGILTDIYSNYHPGTAGCSLKAAACAAQLLDWYYGIDDPDHAAAAAAGSAANFAAANDLSDEAVHENGISVDFAEKFGEIWRNAMSLSFGNTDILSDAGYAPATAESWRPEEVSSLFGTLCGSMALPMPETVWVYYGNENADGLEAALYPTALSEYSLLAALRTAGHFDGSVELLGFTQEGTHLTLDLNAAFAERIRSTGTAGEFILMGSLVNTYLDAYTAETVTVTVEGQSWESGHAVYDSPMTRYE